MPRTLRDLLPGEKAKVLKVGGRGAIRRRIMDMGIIPGVEVEVERYAPLGDPMEVKIKGCHLSLRLAEAEYVLLEGEEKGA